MAKKDLLHQRKSSIKQIAMIFFPICLFDDQKWYKNSAAFLKSNKKMENINHCTKNEALG